MLRLYVDNEVFECETYSDMLLKIMNYVSYDIITDEIIYTENVVKEENDGKMDEEMYDWYFGCLDDKDYKKIVIEHLKKIGVKYKIIGKSEETIRKERGKNVR